MLPRGTTPAETWYHTPTDTHIWLHTLTHVAQHLIHGTTHLTFTHNTTPGDTCGSMAADTLDYTPADIGDTTQLFTHVEPHI